MTTRTATGGGLQSALRLLLFVELYQARYGYSPSFAEMGAGVGMTSSSTVHRALAILQWHGYIRRGHNKWRNIEILHPAPIHVNDRAMRFIPVSALPQVAA